MDDQLAIEKDSQSKNCQKISNHDCSGWISSYGTSLIFFWEKKKI